MSQNDESSANAAATNTDIDFERADFGTETEPPSMNCGLCERPIGDAYFTLDEDFVCEACETTQRDAGPPGSAFSRMAGAVVAGTVAAALAAAIWMLITQLSGYEIGLIAIAVGWVVGVAVQIGNRNTGGIPYQLLAVFLTYTAIIAMYVPMIVEELASRTGDNPAETVEPVTGLAAWIFAIPFAYALPFLAGFENIIGLLIIGFGLWQAWTMTAKQARVWAGPFRVGDTASNIDTIASDEARDQG